MSPAPGVLGPTEARLALARRAAGLRSQGLLWREIADTLGISRSYAQALVDDPDGAKSRARKDSYQGSCVDCGGPTSGSEGRERTPERCAACAREDVHRHRRWTRESVIAAIQRFAAANGRPPLADEWIRSDPVNDYPPRSAVYGNGRPGRGGGYWQPFERWSDAIEAAGFPRPLRGRYVRRPRGIPGRRPIVNTSEGKKKMRDFIILELDEDGRWIEHEPIQSYSEALAIEKYIGTLGDMNGRAAHKFVAVSKARWIVRELQPITTFKAVAAA